MDKIKLFLVYLCLIQVLCVKVKLKEQIESAENNDDNDVFIDENENRMDSVLYKSVRKYACLKNNVEGSHILVYGRKGWTFPRQNISLSLAYPPENPRQGSADEFDNYVITGFQVILSMDGGESEGFISNGGIFNSSIQLTFECRNVTTIGYQFWLYGVTQTTHSSTFKPSIVYYDMC